MHVDDAQRPQCASRRPPEPGCTFAPSLDATRTVPSLPTQRGWRSPAPRGRRAGLLHPERALRGAREELPDELVVGVEEVLGGTGLDDPAAPQHRDVLGD